MMHVVRGKDAPPPDVNRQPPRSMRPVVSPPPPTPAPAPTACVVDRPLDAPPGAVAVAPPAHTAVQEAFDASVRCLSARGLRALTAAPHRAADCVLS